MFGKNRAVLPAHPIAMHGAFGHFSTHHNRHTCNSNRIFAIFHTRVRIKDALARGKERLNVFVVTQAMCGRQHKRVLLLFGLHRDAATTLSAAARQDVLSGAGAHADAESMDLCPACFFRLISAFWHSASILTPHPQLINCRYAIFLNFTHVSPTCPHVDECSKLRLLRNCRLGV